MTLEQVVQDVAEQAESAVEQAESVAAQAEGAAEQAIVESVATEVD